jgi:actin-related protein
MTGRSRLGFPTTEGAVTNWDEMETFYRTIMWSRLNVHVEEQPIFLTESINASRSDREKMTQIMFETLDVYVLSLVQAPYAALTASGRTAGLVIDSGHDSTSSAFFLEGQTRSEHVIFNKAVSGKRITDYLLQQLKSEEGVDLNKVDDFFSVDQIKQKHCFVPTSSVDEPQSILEPIADSLRLAAKEKSVSVSPELQRIGEALFNPSIIVRYTV